MSKSRAGLTSVPYIGKFTLFIGNSRAFATKLWTDEIELESKLAQLKSQSVRLLLLRLEKFY